MRHILNAVNFAAFEARIVQQVADDKVYIDTETTGLSPTGRSPTGLSHTRDMHIEYASKKFGVPLEDVTPAMRREAKNDLFCHLYGGSGVLKR